MKWGFIVLLGLLWLAAVVLGFFLNYLWLLTAVATLVILLLLFWLGRGRRWLKPAVILVLLVAVALLAVGGYVPRAADLGSYAELRGPLAVLGSEPEHVSAADRPPSGDRAALDRFEQRYFELLSHGEVIDDAGLLLEQARRVARALRAREGPPLGLRNLGAAIRRLDASIKVHIVSWEASKQAWRVFLDHSLARARETEPHRMLDFKRAFELEVAKYPIEELHDRIKALQDELEQVVAQLISPLDVHLALSARLIEGAEGAVWNYEEVIRIVLPDDLKATYLDVSELRAESATRGFGQEIGLSYEGPEAAALRTEAVMPINPDADSFLVVNRTSTPAVAGQVEATRLKPVAMEYTLLRWPSPFPSRLKLTLDLSHLGLPDDYTHFVDLDRDEKIEEVRLPAYSFFSSGFPFGAVRAGGADVLRPREDLEPAYFGTHEHVWIELLPAKWLFRNPLVQRYRALLLSENLVSALFVALIAAALAAAFKPPESESPRPRG